MHKVLDTIENTTISSISFLAKRLPKAGKIMDIVGEEFLKILMVNHRLNEEKLNYITAEKLRDATN